jgi:hypothetical protein
MRVVACFAPAQCPGEWLPETWSPSDPEGHLAAAIVSAALRGGVGDLVGASLAG